MKTLLLIPFVLLMASCASQSDSAQSLFDRLEFREGQSGCLRATGQVSLGGNPFAQSSLNVSMVKKQGDAEDC